MKFEGSKYDKDKRVKENSPGDKARDVKEKKVMKAATAKKAAKKR